MYMGSMIILYKKSMIQKLLYGISGFHVSKKEEEILEIANRQILRNMGGLPSSTPNTGLSLRWSFHVLAE